MELLEFSHDESTAFRNVTKKITSELLCGPARVNRGEHVVDEKEDDWQDQSNSHAIREHVDEDRQEVIARGDRIGQPL